MLKEGSFVNSLGLRTILRNDVIDPEEGRRGPAGAGSNLQRFQFWSWLHKMLIGYQERYTVSFF